MRIERVDEFARPVPRRAGLELQQALDDRDAVPIITWRLTDQCALAGADEGIRSVVESQQQAVGLLRASLFNANSRAGAVVARGGVRDQVLVVELDPSVGKQLGLKGESVTGGVVGKEPDLVPLDGQMLIWPRAQNLEEDVRACGAAARMQVVPERSDGSLSRRRCEIGVREASIRGAESQQAVAADEDGRIASAVERERKPYGDRHAGVVLVRESGDHRARPADVLEVRRNRGGLVCSASDDASQCASANIERLSGGGCVVGFGVKGGIPSDHKVIRHARAARYPSVVCATRGSHEIADYAVYVRRPGHSRGNDRAIAIEQGDAGGGATEALYHQGVGFVSVQRECEQIRRRVWR